VILTGCGGSDSSGSKDITGQFIDSAVEGLDYSCSSGNNGKTNTNGEFTCKSNDTVTFSINGFEIGSAKADNIITPKTLHPNDASKATDVAQLVQTLDSDGNPDNGITIDTQSEAYQALSNTGVSLGQVDFDSVMASYIGMTLVSETEANTHLEASIDSLPVESSSGDITWLTAYNEKVSALEAIAMCQEQGGRLPTLEEFVQANNDDVAGFVVTELNPHSIPHGFDDSTDAYFIDYHEEVYGYERYLILPFLGSESGKANDFLDIKDGSLSSSSYSEVVENQSNGAYVRCVKD
jgi:hypothetical protein